MAPTRPIRLHIHSIVRHAHIPPDIPVTFDLAMIPLTASGIGVAVELKPQAAATTGTRHEAAPDEPLRGVAVFAEERHHFDPIAVENVEKPPRKPVASTSRHGSSSVPPSASAAEGKPARNPAMRLMVNVESGNALPVRF